METSTRPNLAKYTFLYLLSLVTLIMTAIAVGNVIFELINKFIPDPLAVGTNAFDATGIKFSIATLVIAAPIYFITTRTIITSLVDGKLERDAAPRRWLTYLIILVSAFVMLGWLIGLLFGFLDGELTLQFGLKAVTALIIAGAVFGFYFYDVRRANINKKDNIVKWSGIAASLVVIASLIVAFFFVESPVEARNRRHDQLLTGNFDQIDSSINSYFSENKKMPNSLSELVNEKRYINESMTKDPLNGEVIEYKVLGDKKYQLCANFSTSNIGVSPNIDYTVTRWPHKEGRQCIDQQVFQSKTEPQVKPIQ